MDDGNDGTACRNRVGGVSYYLEKLDDEAYEGAGQSLRQWIYTRVGEKLLNPPEKNLLRRTTKANCVQLKMSRVVCSPFCKTCNVLALSTLLQGIDGWISCVGVCP